MCTPARRRLSLLELFLPPPPPLFHLLHRAARPRWSRPLRNKPIWRSDLSRIPRAHVHYNRRRRSFSSLSFSAATFKVLSHTHTAQLPRDISDVVAHCNYITLARGKPIRDVKNLLFQLLIIILLSSRIFDIIYGLPHVAPRLMPGLYRLDCLSENLFSYRAIA